MSFWRIYTFPDGRIMSMAVGYGILGSSRVLPPTDGKPYLTDKQFQEAMAKIKTPKMQPVWPWPWMERRA